MAKITNKVAELFSCVYGSQPLTFSLNCEIITQMSDVLLFFLGFPSKRFIRLSIQRIMRRIFSEMTLTFVKYTAMDLIYCVCFSTAGKARWPTIFPCIVIYDLLLCLIERASTPNSTMTSFHICLWILVENHSLIFAELGIRWASLASPHIESICIKPDHFVYVLELERAAILAVGGHWIF